MAMNLVEDYGYDIYDSNGKNIGDAWDEAGKACVKQAMLDQLEAAKRDLHDYQEMANKDMAALQERINQLQTK